MIKHNFKNVYVDYANSTPRNPSIFVNIFETPVLINWCFFKKEILIDFWPCTTFNLARRTILFPRIKSYSFNQSGSIWQVDLVEVPGPLFPRPFRTTTDTHGNLCLCVMSQKFANSSYRHCLSCQNQFHKRILPLRPVYKLNMWHRVEQWYLPGYKLVQPCIC